MKKVVKSIITVIAMSALLLSLAACGSKTETPSNTPAPKQQETQQPASNNSKDIVASVAEIPGLANSPEDGLFIELLKAMDDVYTEGDIKIEVVPFGRSVENAISGAADFHIPMNYLEGTDISKINVPYMYSSKPYGTTAMVLYSNVNKPITMDLIQQALAKGGEFPYNIACGGGFDTTLTFPIASMSNDIMELLSMVESQRIDAFVWAQEDVDAILKAQKLKYVHRSSLGNFIEVFALTKSERGQEVDGIMSSIVEKLEASGKLEEIWAKIHVPYVEWQPKDMGW